jgi:outer membrane protein assembly factor BamE (lipoprotein component of BamABCDE complex)
MNKIIGALFACILAAGTLASNAQAARKLSGVSVTKDQEAAVRIGMTADEVLAVLGRPAS